MIEVTLGMVYSILEWAENDNAGRSELNRAIRRIIELHEENKPKPEPVCYTSRKDLALLAEGYEISGWSESGAEEDEVPLYTTPPTREPLSQSDLGIFIGEFLMIEKPLKNLSHFARIIEKAHGIGVK